MPRRIKVVFPYRPFAPEAPHHVALPSFDWLAALRMTARAAVRTNDCKVACLTDLDADLPVPTHRFETSQRRLMMWMLEVQWNYLRSRHFKCDTVMVGADVLLLRDMRKWFERDFDIAIPCQVRKLRGGQATPLLNSVQLWKHAAKPRLIRLYEAAMDVATGLPEPWHVWGADQQALVELASPVELGTVERSGCRWLIIDERKILRKFSTTMLRSGKRNVSQFALDFRVRGKQHMAAMYAELFRSKKESRK